MPLAYAAIRANNYPLEYLEKDLDDVVPEDEMFYDGDILYLVVDGDPFGISKGTFVTDLIFVLPDDIVSRYDEYESESLQKAIEEIAHADFYCEEAKDENH
ncbi:MAG: hypothetical protein N2255_02595 [Kiritimatiellae bacterium]|nr:hypothetical protein [Kiritimatiellia bacterium]